MTKVHLFISHSSTDDGFVHRFREMLESLNAPTWVDSRELTGGDVLNDKIEPAIRTAKHFIVVVSIKALSSKWVQKEIKIALDEQAKRSDGYKVISVVLPGVEAGILDLLFEKEPMHIFVQDGPNGFGEAMPKVMAAIGVTLPNDWLPPKVVDATPMDELVLALDTPKMEEHNGTYRAVAAAQLIFYPSDKTLHEVQSKRFMFTAPIGTLELGEIRWYIEKYYLWPSGVFKERAQKLEENLPLWGKALFDALRPEDTTVRAFDEWKSHNGCCFSVLIDPEPPVGTGDDESAQIREAAKDLLALPWEIMHDGTGYLMQGAKGARVRRRLPNRGAAASSKASLPIRILLCSPRPEKGDGNQEVSYIDHRINARPMVAAAEALGETLITIDFLNPPTFPALKVALKKARDNNTPYSIIHFDGHGIYDRKMGLGALCFEDPNDADVIGERRLALVHANTLAAELRDFGVPLIFLDACQTAMSTDDPKASVAAMLLYQGVGAVVAMSHSVLVETAKRFVEPFYRKLADGARVGEAMQAGQQALFDDSYRFDIMGAGKLNLADWFVPVLFQEREDQQLFNELPSQHATHVRKENLKNQLGALPPPPSHTFVGRSRMLLGLERLLHIEPYAVIRGSGGMGKTAIGVELVRWLVTSGRFKRAAFVCVESSNVQDTRGILQLIGEQLLPHYSAAQYGNDTAKALQPIERALRDYPTMILFDNMESVLPDRTGAVPEGVADVTQLFDICTRLLKASDAARLLFTTREQLPAPFNDAASQVELGRLSTTEAIELVEQVMARHHWQPPKSDDAKTPEEIEQLVQTVNCHPRALVLLAGEVAKGVSTTRENVVRLMAKLEAENKGDRENSLYASVELSLRRLPAEMRPFVNRLAVCHGGGHLFILSEVMGIEAEQARAIGAKLIEVGLAEEKEYSYLQLDPALPAWLRLSQSAAQLEELTAKWTTAMTQLVGLLYQQRSQDAHLAAQLTLLELPNLMALLDQLEMQVTKDSAIAEAVGDTAGRTEQLVAYLGRPQVLALAVKVREMANRQLPEWGHARFENERMTIERLLEQGALQEAFTRATTLLDKAKAVGPQGYWDADYDLATAHACLGRVLSDGGQAESALRWFKQAETLFDALG